MITAIAWAPESSVERHAGGSDNWPVTWGGDSRIYTAFGDGWGFRSRRAPRKLSLGFASIAGSPGAVRGRNIRSPSGERYGDGATGKKASGLLMVGGRLFMWVRNADEEGHGCELAHSGDRAQTWQWSSWSFERLGYCAFLNFGRDYRGARDGYVYMYSPDTDSAYDEADGVVLTRVPKDRITDRDGYELFAGLDANGRPTWTRRFDSRKPAFVFRGGCNRLDVVYDAPIRRYLMTMRSTGEDGGVDHFGIYDAPEPWGPWTTVYYTERAEAWGESQHIPSKWISADGKTIYLVFSGKDSLSIRRADLTIAAAAAR